MMAAKVDETDERSAQRFLSAMAPIDEHRAHARRRGGRSEEKIATSQADGTEPVTASSQTARNDSVPPGPQESPVVRDSFSSAAQLARRGPG
jgi:hypothetical protein